MTLEASGAYLKRLREAASITRHALSKRVNTSDSQIIRIEEGLDTRISLLFMMVRELGANLEDVMDLALSENSTVDDGIKRAEIWIATRNNKQRQEPEIHPDVFDMASRMTEYELGRWVSAGERMIEERRKSR